MCTAPHLVHVGEAAQLRDELGRHELGQVVHVFVGLVTVHQADQAVQGT